MKSIVGEGIISNDFYLKIFKRASFYFKTKITLLCYISVILVFLGFLYTFPLSTDINNFKSFSSTAFQGLSSILAIVITLTLVSVQIFSQNYSARILRIFFGRKNYALWGLMIIYSFAIIFNLVSPFYVQYNLNNLILFLNFSIWLTVSSLLVLFPYLVYIIQILQPEDVAKMISNQINKDLILKVAKYDNTKFVASNFSDLRKLPSEHDPLLPFTEIIVSAIKNNNTDTAKLGLIELGNIFLELESTAIDQKNGNSVIKYFLDSLEVIRDVAIEYGDTKLLNDLYYIVFRIGFLISEKINDFSVLIRFFEDTPESCGEDSFELLRVHLINKFQILLYELIKRVKTKEIENIYNIYSIGYPNLDEKVRRYKNSLEIEKHQLNIFSLLNYLDRFWITALKNQLWNTITNIKLVLSQVIIKLLEEGLFGHIKHEIFSLLNIALYMVDENPETLEDVLSLLNLTSEELCRKWIFNSFSSENEVHNAHLLIMNILDSLKHIGYESLKKDNYDLKIGSYFIEHELNEILLIENPIILCVANHFKKIASLYLDKRIKQSKLSENEIKDLVMFVLKYNRVFGIDLIKKRSDSVIELIKWSYYFVEYSKELNNNIRLEIGFEVFDSLTEIMKVTADPKIVDLSTRYLSKLRDWAIENDFNLLKLDIEQHSIKNKS